MELTEVIRRGIVTEKTVEMQTPPENQQRKKDADQQTHKYVFEVLLRANKIQIRQAVEMMFPEIHVLAVNTMRMPGKSRSVRTRRGFRKTPAHPWKKAIVTVRASETISQLQP
jgi:large subunit ribosomal protein L23